MKKYLLAKLISSNSKKLNSKSRVCCFSKGRLITFSPGVCHKDDNRQFQGLDRIIFVNESICIHTYKFFHMPTSISYEELQNISESLKAMAHPDRIKILLLIMQQAEQKMSVTQIYENLHLSQPETSRHLNILKNKSILKSSKQGQLVHYFMHSDHPEYYDIIQRLSRKNLVLS